MHTSERRPRRAADDALHDDSLLLRLRDLTQAELGIHISDEKLYSFKVKVGKLLRREGVRSPEELYERLRNREEHFWNLMIQYTTVNYTYFFREEHQFAVLINHIKRERISAPAIWCAAASTGEEVYSLAITLHEHGIHDFLIIASDIDKTVLFTMKRGIYDRAKLGNLSPELHKKYFVPRTSNGSTRFELKGYVKERILAKQLNLVDPLRFERQFDFIFCRNVMIYFDRETRTQVLGTLLANLKTHGALFLGQSESLVGTGVDMQQIGPSVYRKRDA